MERKKCYQEGKIAYRKCQKDGDNGVFLAAYPEVKITFSTDKKSELGVCGTKYPDRTYDFWCQRVYGKNGIEDDAKWNTCLRKLSDAKRSCLRNVGKKFRISFWPLKNVAL
ncbi:hypothetical protein HDU96_010918 [Phlyctochytrium bullatum]|nr:hypothetical protein HDU96_010918 [Phlyctochytrium bullatum]